MALKIMRTFNDREEMVDVFCRWHKALKGTPGYLNDNKNDLITLKISGKHGIMLIIGEDNDDCPEIYCCGE